MSFPGIQGNDTITLTYNQTKKHINYFSFPGIQGNDVLILIFNQQKKNTQNIFHFAGIQGNDIYIHCIYISYP